RLHPSRPDARRSLPLPVADRAPLQMDQAARRIKAFYGTSENAVRIQICTVFSADLLVGILKKRPGIDATLYQIPQLPSVTLFDNTPAEHAWFQRAHTIVLAPDRNQLVLFTFPRATPASHNYSRDLRTHRSGNGSQSPPA